MTTRISARTLARFRDLARSHDLPPQAAEQMMAIHQEHMEGLDKNRRALIAGWATQVRTDPAFGSNAFPAMLHTARQAVARFGGDRLKQVLDETGLGSHPEVIRTFWKVGKATEHLPQPGPKRPPTHEETIRALYPSMYGAKI